MSEYTPEKVAELVAEARRESGFLVRVVNASPKNLYASLADALTAVAAEREEARHWAETMQAQKFEWENREAEARINRDRLHKAIESVEDFVTAHYLDTSMGEKVLVILRAALDKEGSDDGRV